MRNTNHNNGVGKLLRGAILCSASTLALGLMTSTAFAQDAAAPAAADDSTVIVVTGVRGSMQRAMNIKRNASGVVDAISAEDIGKYPDSNLAESVQRIPGVSIDRVNGEGTQVTVRGFGPGYNLVTLNGRVMPTAFVNTIGGDQNGDFTSATSRSFDFANLASDGVSGFEVYKTGKANIQSGGIGATLNIKTLQPLAGRSGSHGSLTAKALAAPVGEHGNSVTPEISGAYTWSNPSKTLGVALFGSYAERDGETRSASVNAWNITKGSTLKGTNGGTLGQDNTDWTPLPAADQLIAYPNDTRYHYSENHSERTNLQGVIGWRPVENLTLSVDALYVENKQSEQRNDQTLWFAQTWDQVKFDGGQPVDTAYYLHEVNANSGKDIGWEQQQRAVNNKLTSLGFNAEYRVNDRLTFTFDAHSSKAEATPGNSNGTSSTLFGVGAVGISSSTTDLSSGFPVQNYVFDGAAGNGNGRLDIGDVSSSVGRTTASSQTQKVDEARFEGSYNFDDDSSFDFGVDLRKTDMQQARIDTQQILGGWGASQPGDVAQFAPGLLQEFCMSCEYEDFTPGNATIAYRGNAVDLLNAVSPHYTGVDGGQIDTTTNQFNQVIEEVKAVYGQISMKGDFLGHDASMVAGLRYEKTDVTSNARQAVPNSIKWTSDNDFSYVYGSDTQLLASKGTYDNWLPNLDFQVHLRDDLIARASYSKTIARPDFGALFATTTVGTPSRPTAYGVQATASYGDPGLLPLESSNIDFSVEWYYGPSNYVSLGFYNKDVANFLGTGKSNQSLFGIQDPTSGAPGTRSGEALDAIGTIANLGGDRDVNLFSMVALIDENNGDVAAAKQHFVDNLETVNGVLQLSDAESKRIYNAYDIVPDANDPEMNFSVSQQINNRSANIHGFELQLQHFFGDTGFGMAASYTTVDGDVGFDNSSLGDQFALLGLSNTYNVTAIYDKGDLSGRLSYNWRDKYLSGTGRDGDNRNPTYVNAFGQLDLSVNYNLTPSVQLSLDGLNLTKEHLRTNGRADLQLYFAQELDTRYQFGVRYKF
ncbi:MAG: TonB-dependent receptor [Asticcacaulis sp.]